MSSKLGIKRPSTHYEHKNRNVFFLLRGLLGLSTIDLKAQTDLRLRSVKRSAVLEGPHEERIVVYLPVLQQ